MTHACRALALVFLVFAPLAARAGGVPLCRTGYAMGTLLSVEVCAPDTAAALAALDTVFAIASRLDSLLSNYRPESELCGIAGHAPAPVAVSAATLDFLARTLDWSARTGGALDPTVGPLVSAWGFDSERPARPDTLVLDSLARLCDYRRVRLDSASRTVQLPAGFRLDPGATGKGYALAVAESTLTALGVSAWSADFGGQLYRRGTDSLLVPVRHPRSDTTALAWLSFAQGSVSTSGDYERYFDLQGRRYAHILDPRTGWPVQGRAAVSVYAPNPFAADALSTALFVLGPGPALPLLESARAGALFAEWNGDSLVLIIVGEWPAAP
jgi:thiamine biosynthesis lipoprotein